MYKIKSSTIIWCKILRLHTSCFLLSMVQPEVRVSRLMPRNPIEVLLLLFEKLNSSLSLSPSAPDRAPLNIQWTIVGSTLSLHWDPVVAMETESKVTGYLVGPDLAPSGSELVNGGITAPPISLSLFLRCC